MNPRIRDNIGEPAAMRTADACIFHVFDNQGDGAGKGLEGGAN